MFNCERCHRPVTAHTRSFFNTQHICMECVEVEQAHPLYAKARAAEQRSVDAGDFNYPGIGAPPDLVPQHAASPRAGHREM